MKRVLFLIVISCAVVSLQVLSQSRESLMGVIVTTVDEHGSAMKADTVRWWYQGQRNVKHDLHCKTKSCSQWRIDEPISGSFVVHADKNIVKDDDAHCWDLYMGEREIKEWVDIKNIQIVLSYSSTVCS